MAPAALVGTVSVKRFRAFNSLSHNSTGSSSPSLVFNAAGERLAGRALTATTAYYK
jgi:hypothetical protein